MMGRQGKAQIRTFTQTARRAQIVEAAIETLAESGYRKASFSRISQQAELSSTGMISYHFSGKPELFSEVARTILDTAQKLTTSRMSDERTHHGKLSAYITSAFDFITTHPVHTRALIEIVTMIRDRQISGLDSVERSITSVDQLTDLLQQGRDAGEFGITDSLTTALAIRGAIDEILRHHLSRTTMDLNRCARELTTMVDRCVKSV
ncbi:MULTISPECIES: TetR/AcrR family transcriptional regulator [unclassified Streptomyces]|uniref:TetR/AcrR family transcriptional regulator n=1 Tax=unclassified Streptomyces TaxID=2593676 RepID=UPI003800AA59